MQQNVVTEIVEFRIVSGISDEMFERIVNDLETNFHSKQSGFIDTELVKGKEERQWVMIQHWASLEEAKEVSKRMFKTPVTEEFRQAVDPAEVKLSIFKQVKTWQL